MGIKHEEVDLEKAFRDYDERMEEFLGDDKMEYEKTAKLKKDVKLANM